MEPTSRRQFLKRGSAVAAAAGVAAAVPASAARALTKSEDAPEKQLPDDPSVEQSMPAFFYQRNMIGPAVPADERAQNIRYQDAEVHAIVTYLFSHSSHRVWQGPSNGNAANGQKVVENVGCLACHLNSESFTAADGKTRVAHRDDYPLERNFGFNLANVGTKTYPGWIYNWIRNPHNYDPNAPMPSLRLTDQEAADVTAYLMTLQKPQFMKTPIRPVDPKAVHDLAKSYLLNTLTDRDAEAK